MQIGRIIEVASDRQHLFRHRGFLAVRASTSDATEQDTRQVPLDDIAAVMANAHGLTYSNNILVALAVNADVNLTHLHAGSPK